MKMIGQNRNFVNMSKSVTQPLPLRLKNNSEIEKFELLLRSEILGGYAPLYTLVTGSSIGYGCKKYTKMAKDAKRFPHQMYKESEVHATTVVDLVASILVVPSHCIRCRLIGLLVPLSVNV